MYLVDIQDFHFWGDVMFLLQYSRNMSYSKLVMSLHLSAGNIAQGRSYQVCQETDDANTES